VQDLFAKVDPQMLQKMKNIFDGLPSLKAKELRLHQALQK